MSKQADYVLRTVEERGIRFVRLWFTDIQGFLKSVAITPAELETAFEEGMAFDGSAIDGFSRVQEADMLARPDPTTFQILPWRPSADGVARMYCDIYTIDGEPFDGDPRHVLKRTLDSAKEMGYTPYVAPELEYFYFTDSSNRREPLDRGGYFDLTPLDVAQEYRRESIIALEQLGIPVEYSHHEVSPSQHEMDLRFTDALTMADNILTARLAVKEVALKHNIFASFMPKPREDFAGNAMHLHLSLFEGEHNAFYAPEGDLSSVAEHFIAGLLIHAREITAVTNQWVNSYKRLNGGFEAPSWATWGHNNESALVRVPTAKRDKPDSVRVEYRAPDPACNPYLALAVILSAGLKGIQDEYVLDPEVSGNVTEIATHPDSKIQHLPTTLSEAVDAMEQSALVRETLGDHVFTWFIRNKRKEWIRYNQHVSGFELDEYLPLL
ncbi:MAG: glutamine synthetase [Acidimicrobiia bacterium]|nr:glutamine synthetase [Acidimicrobiia bacterium]